MAKLIISSSPVFVLVATNNDNKSTVGNYALHTLIELDADTAVTARYIHNNTNNNNNNNNNNSKVPSRQRHSTSDLFLLQQPDAYIPNSIAYGLLPADDTTFTSTYCKCYILDDYRETSLVEFTHQLHMPYILPKEVMCDGSAVPCIIVPIRATHNYCVCCSFDNRLLRQRTI